MYKNDVNLSYLTKSEEKLFIHDIIPIIGKYFVEPKYTKFMDFATCKISINSKFK